MAGEEAEAVEAEAEYHDGQQARPLWLRARLTPASCLELRRAGGEPIAAWPAAALRVVDRAGGALRLAPDGSDARVIVSDARLAAALEAAQRPRRRAALKRRLRMAALAAVAVPAGVLGLWKGWPPAADALARAVPAGLERSIGAATASALIGSKRVCDAPEGQAALDGLAARLAAAGGVDATDLRVRVLDSPTVNALAAPGGEVIVYRGLLDRAEAAEEVAGVLAHEIGHVEHRHGLRGVARAAGLFVLAGALSGGSDAAALGVVLATLAHTRDFEREADAAGARILVAAGIGTGGLETFFARLEKASGGPSSGVWAYVGTHPANADRAAALRAAERPTDPAPALPPAAWAAVKGICGPATGSRRAEGGGAAPTAPTDRPAAKAGSPPRRRLGSFGGWEAWTGEERGDPICYTFAYASPAAPGGGEAAGKGAKARLWVTHRPWRGMDGIGFTPDRRAPEGVAMRIAFGERGAAMRQRGSHAVPRDSAALSAALRAAAAEGVAEAAIGWDGPGDGAAQAYKVPLNGLVEAHAAISAACAEAPPAAAPAR